jgi:hypothetical protein
MKRQISKKIITLCLGIFLGINFAQAWNEEKTDSLGPVITVHSLGEFHSSFHYDLTLLLAVKMGFSPDTAELMARYCALVDQINPKPNYPYSWALNSISIPDTIPGWDESLAGTERGNFATNSYNERPSQYWHFPFRNPDDTISGAMVFGNYPEVYKQKFRQLPYSWRIPLVANLPAILNWAIYGTGSPGYPDNSTPVQVMFFDAVSQTYKPVQPGSIQAFSILLHCMGDTYSHEHCMVNDTLRSHPDTSDFCGLTYHSDYEFAYHEPVVAMNHAEPAAQAVWRALREYKRILNIQKPALWTADNNGFQDGDGIPDQLEDDYDGDYSETFMERWKSPATNDLTDDGIINHSDHTTWRISLCNEEYCNMSAALQPTASIIVGQSFTLNPTIDYFDSLYWTSDGDGVFSDFQIQNPTYFAGNNDTLQGFVVLTLHIVNFRGCAEEIVSSVNLSILKYQTLSLPQGWSGISAVFIPQNTSFEVLMQPLDDNLTIIQNLHGFYWPSSGINTLGNWDFNSGYQIKLTEPAELSFLGQIPVEKSLNLGQGWNLIPVLSPCQQPISQIFGDELAKVVIIKEAVGTKLYWPASGVFSIINLEPGKSYLVFLTENAIINFQNCGKQF